MASILAVEDDDQAALVVLVLPECVDGDTDAPERLQRDRLVEDGSCEAVGVWRLGPDICRGACFDGELRGRGPIAGDAFVGVDELELRHDRYGGVAGTRRGCIWYGVYRVGCDVKVGQQMESDPMEARGKGNESHRC